MSALQSIAACVLLVCSPATTLAGPQPESKQAPHSLGQEGPALADLRLHAAQLRNEDSQRRARAIAYLSTLPQHALSSIKLRVAELARGKIERNAAIAVLEQLLYEVNPQGDETPPPLAQGAQAVLSHQRDEATCIIVEAGLLLQSLEAMKTTGAGMAMAEFFDIAEGAMGNELRRARTRAGEWLLPALIRLRSDDRKAVKRWAQAGVRKLGVEDPKLATNLEDAWRVAEVVRAYSDPLDYDAMPTLVRLTRDKRVQVRGAARQAVDRFGQNAIWQLRQLYEELTSSRAKSSWSAEQTAQALYAVIDRQRMERAEHALTAATEAQQSGDLAGMQQQFALALSAMPDHPKHTSIAEGYAEAGEQALAEGDYPAAERAYLTAVHLAEKRPQAERYRTQLAFVRAEESFHKGLVDRSAYEYVLARDPGHAGAQTALDKISGRDAQRLQQRKKLAAAGAGALLLVAAGLFARQKWRCAAAANAQA